MAQNNADAKIAFECVVTGDTSDGLAAQICPIFEKQLQLARPGIQIDGQGGDLPLLSLFVTLTPRGVMLSKLEWRKIGGLKGAAEETLGVSDADLSPHIVERFFERFILNLPEDWSK